MLATLLVLAVALTPTPLQDPPATPPATAPAAPGPTKPAPEPEPLDAVFERLLADKNTAEIDRTLRARAYEVIQLVDGYLESWLAAQERPDEAKNVDPARLMELAQTAATHADAVFKTNVYSRYAGAWKGWTAEQRLQFRDGQAKYAMGREAQKAKNLDAAKIGFGASLKLAEPLGDLWGVAQAEQSLGDISVAETMAATDAKQKSMFMNSALAHHMKAAHVFGELRHHGVLRSLRALGTLYEQNGDLAAARKALEKMIQVAVEARRLDSAGPVKKDLARICRALGDEEAAKKWES